ncbi:MAG TPA: APC family permease [Terriglobales bacterium]|nr:APC family permease [Terriglobales bacterium]
MSSHPQPVHKKGITLWPLVAATYFMASGGPYGLEEAVGSAGYLGAIVLVLVTPLIWSLPTGLMIAELASAIPAEGGYYVWVRRAIGPFWGFQEAWLSLASSVFDLAIYPTLFVAYLGRLLPGADEGWHRIVIAASVILVCLIWNLAGGRAVGEGSLGMLFVMLGPFVVLIIAAFVRANRSAHTDYAPATQSGLIAALLVCMWNYMGYDNAANVAGEVEDPQRTYPLGIILTIVLVAIGYVVPIAAMSRTRIAPNQWTTGSWATLGGMVAGHWLTIAIVAGGMVSSFGQFNALLMSYSRLPLAMAEDDLLPRVFARVQSRTGAPYVAIIACALLYGACLGLGFDRLVTLDVLLWGASLVLEFLALYVLRVKEPQMPRPFRVPGGRAGAALIGVLPTALLVLAGFRAEHEQIAGMSVWLFGLGVMAAGVAAYAIFSRFSLASKTVIRQQ